MEYTRITRYLNCDILFHKNDVEWYGFSKNMTEEEIIVLAQEKGCHVITKNGRNGKWYLKGKGKTIEYLKERLDAKSGQARDGVFSLLLE